MGAPDAMGEWSRLQVIEERRRARWHLIGAAVFLAVSWLAVSRAADFLFN